MAAAAMAGAAFAADIPVTTDITTDTLWTKNNVYDLQDIVFAGQPDSSGIAAAPAIYVQLLATS